MKKSILLFMALCFGIAASCQDDKTFSKEVKANAGITTTFLRFSDGTILTTKPLYEPPLGNPAVNGYVLSSTTAGVRSWIQMSSVSMVYPSAGIPISTGAAWGVSITNNSSNWNTAYSWGNHTGLYRLITWVPTWNDVTGKPTLFTPIAHTHDYVTEITNKPPAQDLTAAIMALGYLPVPSKTTDQINATTPTGGTGIVYDATLNVYKVYKTGGWVIVITNN